jgi:hypothetical protein
MEHGFTAHNRSVYAGYENRSRPTAFVRVFSAAFWPAHIQSIKGRVSNQSVSVAASNEAAGQITANIDRLNENAEQQSASVAQASSAVAEMITNRACEKPWGFGTGSIFSLLRRL